MWALVWAASQAQTAWAQSVTVPNPSFETGKDDDVGVFDRK